MAFREEGEERDTLVKQLRPDNVLEHIYPIHIGISVLVVPCVELFDKVCYQEIKKRDLQPGTHFGVRRAARGLTETKLEWKKNQEDDGDQDYQNLPKADVEIFRVHHREIGEFFVVELDPSPEAVNQR